MLSQYYANNPFAGSCYTLPEQAHEGLQISIAGGVPTVWRVPVHDSAASHQVRVSFASGRTLPRPRTTVVWPSSSGCRNPFCRHVCQAPGRHTARSCSELISAYCWRRSSEQVTNFVPFRLYQWFTYLACDFPLCCLQCSPLSDVFRKSPFGRRSTLSTCRSRYATPEGHWSRT